MGLGGGVMNQDLAGQALTHVSSTDRALGARGQGSHITKISSCQHQGVTWLFFLFHHSNVHSDAFNLGTFESSPVLASSR